MFISLPTALRTLFAAIASLFCITRDVSAQYGQTTATIKETVINCKVGLFRTYDVDFYLSAQSADKLVINAIIAERNAANPIRLSFCTDPHSDSIRTGIMTVIASRIEAVNACNDAEVRTIKSRNFQAALQDVKHENEMLKGIRELIAFGEGSESNANVATEGMEKSFEALDKGHVAASSAEQMVALLDHVRSGGGAARHLAEEIIKGKVVDNGVDPIVKSLNPFRIGGELEKLYLDFSYSDRMLEIISFSSSVCR
jgi:hypothetical protein